MAYADLAALEDRYGAAEIVQLADRDRDGVADAGVLAVAQDSADRLIDSYLATAGFTVPVAAPPAVIVACSAALQRYFLFGDARPEAVAEDWKFWTQWLQGVATGKILLSLPGAAEPAAGSPAYEMPERLFTFDTLERF